MAIAEVHVVLKPGLVDAQGKTVLKALQQLGHLQVTNVRIGKYITLEVDDAALTPALQQQLDVMCRQLLANPVIEDYSVSITAPAGADMPGAPAAAVTDGASLPTATAVPPGALTATPTGAATAATTPPASLAPSEQLSAARVSASDTGTPDPWALDYDRYAAMTPTQQLAVQELAWQRHSAWIQQQLRDHKAAWIMCAGGQVLAHGPTLDDYPTEARAAAAGQRAGLAAFLFTAPRAS